MKTILFVFYFTFGPGLATDNLPLIISVEEESAQACADQVERYRLEGYARGRTGNLPSYRYVFAAWCEDRDEPWSGSTVQPGPYYPRDKAERDRWTPVLWGKKENEP